MTGEDAGAGGGEAGAGEAAYLVSNLFSLSSSLSLSPQDKHIV
jgi:hypothetical protein